MSRGRASLTLRCMRRGLLLCICLGQFTFEKALQTVKVYLIELPEPLHPDGGGAHGVGFEFAPFHTAAFLLRDETGAGEDRQVFGNRGERHLERLGNIGDGHVIFEQHRQDRAPGPIAQSREYEVEIMYRFVCHEFGDMSVRVFGQPFG